MTFDESPRYQTRRASETLRVQCHRCGDVLREGVEPTQFYLCVTCYPLPPKTVTACPSAEVKPKPDEVRDVNPSGLRLNLELPHLCGSDADTKHDAAPAFGGESAGCGGHAHKRTPSDGEVNPKE